MNLILESVIHNESEMLLYGEQLAQVVKAGDVIFFRGQLGAGKTTLIRGFLSGLGYTGKVKSPTYSLTEIYEFGVYKVIHTDLYRLKPGETLNLGLSDYLNSNTILLVEWPEFHEEYLPVPTLRFSIVIEHTHRIVRLEPPPG